MSGPQAGKAALAVLGAGSWGTALALTLARNGHLVELWGHNAGELAVLARDRANTRYLPGYPFPDALRLEPDLGALVGRVEGVVVAVPSAAVGMVLEAWVAAGLGHGPWVFAQATKGMGEGGHPLSEQAAQILGPTNPWTVISGPTFAREVAAALPTALTVAGRDVAVTETVAGWLRNDRVRVYTTDDVIGVEIGGAVKNVLAIAAGISDGLGFGANARAALITRGLSELTRLGVALGGAPGTFMGLSGLGDLVLTATDNLSRNRQVGLAVGRGEALGDVLLRLGQVAEGVRAATEVRALATRHAIEMPIVEEVYGVLFEGRPALEAVARLLGRQPKRESLHHG